MAIKFYNIKSREIRVAETEPMIAAMFNSGDLGPNSKNGQDFGWRIAPEVALELRRIKNNPEKLEYLATHLKKSVEEIGDTDILLYISAQTDPDSAPVASDQDFEAEYLEDIRRLDQASRPKGRSQAEEEAEAKTAISENKTKETTEEPVIDKH